MKRKIKTLKNKKEFFICPIAPFHFNGTFHKPSHFPDKLTAWQSGKYSMLAVHYIWENIFWRRKNERIDWLEKEIRL